MKLNLNRFNQHLNAQKLAPAYLISGDEILLVEEARDRLREKARTLGFSDRQVYYVDHQFDWNKLLNAANNLALFSEKMLIELHVVGGKVGTSGKEVLSKYFNHLPDDKILAIITDKLDQNAARWEWIKKLDQVGVYVQIWPITSQEFPRWIHSRLLENGLQVQPEAVQFLAEQCEGNLLAAKQFIEKISLSSPQGSGDPVDREVIDTKLVASSLNHQSKQTLGLNDIISIISDQGHYDVFELVDYTLLGDLKRVMRIFSHLQEAGIEPILVLWALARELRGLIKMEQMLKTGKALTAVLSAHHVWDKRKPIISQALKRFCKDRSRPVPIFLELLQFAGQIDLVIKGIEPGDPWQMLEQLCLRLGY
ncbi:MAG: DNA polymerase III subunit delta [Gammaproteobacteria bacterium]|nr:DNA polymerase III subunit delta [Gammaproteobacteria bacterium]